MCHDSEFNLKPANLLLCNDSNPVIKEYLLLLLLLLQLKSCVKVERNWNGRKVSVGAFKLRRIGAESSHHSHWRRCGSASRECRVSDNFPAVLISQPPEGLGSKPKDRF